MIRTSVTIEAAGKHDCYRTESGSVFIKLGGSWQHTLVFQDAVACEAFSEFLRSVVSDIHAEAMEEAGKAGAIALEMQAAGFLP